MFTRAGAVFVDTGLTAPLGRWISPDPDWNPRSDPTPRETGLKAVGPLPVARQVLEESRRQSSLAWNKVPQVGCFLDAAIRGN